MAIPAKISRARRRDRRRERRDHVVCGEVAIVCEDQLGLEIKAEATLLDVSVHGARFRTQRGLPLNSSVKFHHRELAIGGSGVVRYCNWSPSGYEIGVEFRQGTGWPGANGDIAKRTAASSW